MTDEAKEELFCAECSSKDISTSSDAQQIEYGSPVEVVILVTVPLHKCNSCGFAFTDHVAEDIREQAVSAYKESKVNEQQIKVVDGFAPITLILKCHCKNCINYILVMIEDSTPPGCKFFVSADNKKLGIEYIIPNGWTMTLTGNLMRLLCEKCVKGGHNDKM